MIIEMLNIIQPSLICDEDNQHNAKWCIIQELRCKVASYMKCTSILATNFSDNWSRDQSKLVYTM